MSGRAQFSEAPVAELKAALRAAAARVGGGARDDAEPALDRPPRADFGDYSTNAAMLLAPAIGEGPREVADRLAQALKGELGDSLVRAEVAGPGFVNLFLSDSWYRDAAAAMAARGEPSLPRSDATERVLIEFVSANPTGPLTAAGGRHAAYGDAIARILAFTGGEVEREYYLNDVGGQIERFADSIAARMRGDEPPEDGYRGEYVREVAAELAAEGIQPDDLEAVAERGVAMMRTWAEETLRGFGVEFESWFSERSLHRGGELDRALSDLRAGGHTYESEGATWLRTTSFDDDKDRVLMRSEGGPTYLLADIAYHRSKLERGAERLIDILGADHHGYVARLKAGIAALGFDSDRLEVAIMQLVQVVERGERAQMSKRKGEFVTLDELIDDIGADAARFFMLQRSHDTPLDLDLELARKTSNDNPVYYVQYAHARIASILRKAGEEKVDAALTAPSASSVELDPAERVLIKRLLELPDEVSEAAEKRAPHRLCAYATAIAADFHVFYRDCKVLDAGTEAVETERIRLCMLTKRTIARTLSLLGISAPERM